MPLSRHCDLTSLLDDCHNKLYRDKLLVDFSGTLLMIVATKFVMSRRCSTTFYLALCCEKVVKCHDNFQLSSQGSFSIFVATFLLPFAFSFVATIVKFSRHSALLALAKFVAFLALFASFSLNPYKT